MSFFGFIAGLLFPGVCAECGSASSVKGELCVRCRAVYAEETRESCPKCGKTAGDCECGTDFVRHTGTLIGERKFAALTFYKSRADYPDSDRLTERMIFALKERGRYASFFAEELALHLHGLFRKNGSGPEGWKVTYIPRTDEKKRKHGMDQSEEIAVRLAKELKIPFVRMFARRMGAEQKNLGRKERAENMESSLVLVKKVQRGGKFLVVDDIITSGSSMETAARLLRFEGAAEVFPAVIARTIKKKADTEPHETNKYQ